MAQFLFHTLTEGERIHYRSLSEVMAAIYDGYLELQYTMGQNVVPYHMVIRRSVEGQFQLMNAPWGFQPTEVETRSYTTLEALVHEECLDLHAWRWYPLHSGADTLAVNPASSDYLKESGTDLRYTHLLEAHSLYPLLVSPFSSDQPLIEQSCSTPTEPLFPLS